MDKIEEYRFFSKPLLKEANEAAHREKRSRCINPSIIRFLPLNYVYHVIGFMYHKKNELRLTVEISKGKVELLDISVTRYESLPTVRYYENGLYDVKFSDRPYQNGREWQESETIKPIRKQTKFRKEVLEAYNNCCAICDLKEIGLLRASHILDVKDGGPDTTQNGISLCVNHEIAFDRGLILIHPDYTIECSTDLGVNVKRLKLPTDKNNYPSPEYLKRKMKLIIRKQS